ncbi:MAG TPA: alkaline phosphatase family protein, partial [Polyangia bacterium]
MTHDPQRLAVVLWDGARPDVLEDLLARGDLPHVARCFAERGRLGRAVTVFPSTTGPAHLPFITGCFPGTCNVPGIRWLDRREYARTWLSVDRYRSYTGPGLFRFAADMRRGLPSLHELFPDHASAYAVFLPGVRAGRSRQLLLRLMRHMWQARRRGHTASDDIFADYAVRAAAERPDLLFATFYAIDMAAHVAGPTAPATLDAYRRLDRALGRLTAALRQAGVLDETLLALVSDHGFSTTSAHVDLDALCGRHLGRVLTDPARLVPAVAAQAACMISGNSMAHVYVRGPRGWPRSCPDEELPRAAGELIDELLGHPAIDLVATRTAAGEIRVRGGGGEALIGRPAGGGVTYATRGSDPFGYGALPPRMTAAEALARTFDTDYPDAPVQLLQLFDSPRSGDVVVTARPGSDLRADHLEDPRHLGSHGALHREHMLVPFGLSRPFPAGPRRTVDLVPAVAARHGRAAGG